MKRPSMATIALLLRLVLSVAVMAMAMYTLRYASDSLWQVRIGTALLGLAEGGFVFSHARVRGWIRAVSIDQWRAIDRETVRAPADAGTTSVKIMIILVVVAVSLTLQEYVGSHDAYLRFFPNTGSKYWELWGFAWWSGWRVLGYVVIPMITLAFLPGERILDYHISFKGFWKHLWIYVVMFACILPVVVIASTTDAFRHTYPFYRMANRSQTDLWSWEALYAAQFLSLEFFFRGFLLQGLRRHLGANAIFVMIVPYCMIHYGKPMPETLGAIGAGLILGTLAMRTKSIWGGVLIHVGVATTMDVLALRGCPDFGSGRYCH